MYYVLQVAPGEEEKVEMYVRVILPDEIYGECFHLTRHMKKKFHGKWMDVQEKLLPGYVFITTENIKRLFLEIKKIPLFTGMVGRDGVNFTEMLDCDVDWLEKIRIYGMKNTLENAGTENTITNIDVSWHQIGLSQININEGNQIKIISGPLMGIEGMIKKINLHKRVAEVEIPFMKRRTVIYLGIELLERK